ncbi:MAG: hypothetical protein O2913_13640, partial [Chloroflexi bacterium]|nr:hypothetical protein [Chloroflexota bacterium]
ATAVRILGAGPSLSYLSEFPGPPNTFPIYVEVLLVPALAIIAAVNVVVGSDENYALVADFMNNAVPIIGLLILVIALTRAIADSPDLYTVETFRKITLTPMLSLLLVPWHITD